MNALSYKLCWSTVGSAIVFAAIVSKTASAQMPCPLGHLPAYAHNDYENPRPLADALRLGFRGVEVDVFLLNGVLRVGHDRRRARTGGTLEGLYLTPLRAIIARCGVLTIDHSPWFLAIELKQRSEPTYAALRQLLLEYRDLFTPASAKGAAPVEVILVGWHPELSLVDADRDGFLRVQHRIADLGGGNRLRIDGMVRLLSVDYGKTIGKRSLPAARRKEWLAMLRETKRANSGRLLRVHNLPADSSVYAELLGAGVDLIGTKDLVSSRRILLASTPR